MSPSPLDSSVYSTILFIDSMVALEAKPLPTLPWHEIDSTGQILLLVVPQVNTEIDKRKRDGRLGKRAREFNRLISPAAESASATRICDGPPIVDIAIAACDRVDWDALDDLDPESGDARIVAQVLHARAVPLARKLLFSHDINPIAMASRHGLKTSKVPDHWLLEPEPSPSEKQIAKLRARVKELESTEPSLEIRATFNVHAPLQLFQVRKLSDEGQSELVRHVLAQNPKPAQDIVSIYSLAGGYDSSLDERYEEFRTVIVPRHASMLHRRLETHYSQVPFLLCVENTGHIPAENLVVTLTAFGGTLHDRFVCYPLFGPPAPRPRPYDPLRPFQNFNVRHLQRQVGRHEMEFAAGPDRSDTIEVHCADFRQGRDWRFDGIAQVDPRARSPFKVRVNVTASNLHGTIERSFELKYTSKNVASDELIDLEKREYRIEIPMAGQFAEAIEAEDREWFDFVDDDENGDSD